MKMILALQLAYMKSCTLNKLELNVIQRKIAQAKLQDAANRDYTSFKRLLVILTSHTSG